MNYHDFSTKNWENIRDISMDIVEKCFSDMLSSECKEIDAFGWNAGKRFWETSNFLDLGYSENRLALLIAGKLYIGYTYPEAAV